MVSRYYARFLRIETNWGFAFLCWIGTGIYVFATTEARSFLSWQWIIYLLVGTPVATFIFGTASQLLIGMLGSKKLQGHLWGPDSGQIDVVLVVEAVVIFLTARWVLRQIL